MIIKKGHSLKEYMKFYGNEYKAGNLWDFSKEDLNNGAIETKEEVVYWLIKGRYYEVPNGDWDIKSY